MCQDVRRREKAGILQRSATGNKIATEKWRLEEKRLDNFAFPQPFDKILVELGHTHKVLAAVSASLRFLQKYLFQQSFNGKKNICFSWNFGVCSRNLDELGEKNILYRGNFCLWNDTKKPRVGKMFAKSDKDNRNVRREETNEKLKVSARKTATKIPLIHSQVGVSNRNKSFPRRSVNIRERS